MSNSARKRSRKCNASQANMKVRDVTSLFLRYFSSFPKTYVGFLDTFWGKHSPCIHMGVANPSPPPGILSL